MRISQSEIIIALNTIKKVCEEYIDKEEGCTKCPLRTKTNQNFCVLKKEAPTDWKIKECEEWRAFE